MTRLLGTLILALAAAGPLPAADPPKLTVTFPKPTAPPQPAPSGYPRLTADRLFVVEADGPCFLKALPANLVSVAADEGPLRIRGKFADGPDKVETRTYKGKHVFTIEAAGTGRVELLFIPVGVQREQDIVTATVDVDAGEGPRPPPGPGPQPPPGPTPPPVDPSPFPGPGLHVLFVYDSANTTRPAAQNSVLYGKAVRDYLKAKCAADPAGDDGKAYRIYPANADVSRAPKIWADAFTKALAAGKGKDLIVIGDGKTGATVVLSANEPEALALLKKYGGE